MKDSELFYLEERRQKEKKSFLSSLFLSFLFSFGFLVFSCFVHLVSHPPTLGTKPREDGASFSLASCCFPVGGLTGVKQGLDPYRDERSQAGGPLRRY